MDSRAQELALADEWRIPVIGVAENSELLHPWLRSCCNVIAPTIDEAIVLLDEFIGLAEY